MPLAARSRSPSRRVDHHQGIRLFVTARLVPATEDDERPWLRLREHGPAKWHGDPLAPLDEEWEADKKVDE
jgi:hypothetical protein